MDPILKRCKITLLSVRNNNEPKRFGESPIIKFKRGDYVLGQIPNLCFALLKTCLTVLV